LSAKRKPAVLRQDPCTCHEYKMPSTGMQ
jgi:hypothetical protein